MNIKLSLFLALVTTFSLSTLAASGHWRWTAEDGTVQYSDRPPEGVEAEFVKFSVQRVSSTAKGEQEQKAAESAKAKGSQELEVMPEKDPALCEQAKKNLKALEASHIRIKEADGTRRILTEEEKEEQRIHNRKFVKIHC